MTPKQIIDDLDIFEGTWITTSADGVQKRFPQNKSAEADAWKSQTAKPAPTPKVAAPTTRKLTLDDVWRKVEEVVANIFPDGDPIDWLGPWLQKQGITDFRIGETLDRAAKKNGYEDIYAYYDSMKDMYSKDMAAEGELNEISNELLARYKTAAGQSASAADKRGDYSTGNKRFSGIVKATKKQFANDAKKTTEGHSFIDAELQDRGYQLLNNLGDADMDFDEVVELLTANNIPEHVARIVALDAGRLPEGTMGGINRSAPAQDVSYEKVLDPNPESAHMRVVGEEQLDELNVDTLKSYAKKTEQPRPTDRLGKVVKHKRGHEQAIQKIAVKTGDKTPRQAASRTYEERLAEFVELDEDKQVVNIGMTMSGKPGLFTNGMMAIPLSPEDYKQGLEDRDYLESLAAKYGFVLRQDSVDEDKKDDVAKQFSDILGKQDQEQKAAAPKGKIVSIPYHGWEIRYRKAVTPGEKINWKIFDKTGAEKHSGTAMDERGAVGDAEEWINSGGGTNQKASSKVTIDFNVDFARQFAPGGETFYVMFDNDGKTPMMYMSTEPQQGFKKSAIRTQRDKATGTTTLLPSASLSPNESNGVGLQPNGRYILGAKDPIDQNTDAFPLIYQSTSQSKTDAVRLGKPGLTVATSRDVDEDITPWGGYTPDDKKAGALAKAPRSTMQGKGDVRFSDMIKDAIETHGLPWAFDYYVKKHGLPPKQFQIFAGLTTKPKAAEPKKPDWTDPSKSNRPKPQSWWQKLRGKLPFEE